MPLTQELVVTDGEGQVMAKEKVLRSSRVYAGKIINVRVDTVRLEKAGKPVEATREVVEHAPVVVMAPVDSQGRVLLVRQYRHAVGEELLELPAGGIEPGESPAAAARRELQEETGFTADDLTPMGRFWMSPGFLREEMHAFLARGLRPSRRAADEDEDIELVPVPLAELPGMIKRGEIRDAKTIAALLMAMQLYGLGQG
jgi:ADP-ribose pyrophosphatase